MNNYTHQTAPTQFVEAAGIRFAYRRFGARIDIPLLLPVQRERVLLPRYLAIGQVPTPGMYSFASHLNAD
jgi:hypothetical protein